MVRDLNDYKIRMAVFDWLSDLSARFDDVIPRKILEGGMPFQGDVIRVIGPQGIFKPAQLALPISITTSPNSPYDDRLSDQGYLAYKYRGSDPEHPDNAGLRALMHRKIALVYFHGIVPGKYSAAWPVYIEHDSPNTLTFTVSVDAMDYIGSAETEDRVREDHSESRRKYITTTVRRRLHQQSFRERVVAAYRKQCALCRLRHPELLEAAHIVPDAHEDGEPIVKNGISLCRLHHGAYDQNILGISPDYLAEIRIDILEEIDGPMLRHGLQEMHGRKIYVPRKADNKPDRDRLAFRYEKFKTAG